MKRHIAQIKKNCRKGDLLCRRKNSDGIYLIGLTIAARYKGDLFELINIEL
ncbi:MAG: hypothetical protein NC820_05180 [Candidatus Omnitrophica bacterium]|nr:hypothetical protein [Candidatus Omnitrophota bacterium]